MGTKGLTTSPPGPFPLRRLVLAIPIGLVVVVLIVRALVRSPSGAAGGVAAPAAAARLFGPTAAQNSGSPGIKVDWPTRNVRDPFHSDYVFPATLPKPLQPEADERVANARRLEALRKEAKTHISLHGTMVGARPMAVINGEMRRQGEVIAGFRLKQVEAKHIVVERDGFELVIHVPE